VFVVVIGLLVPIVIQLLTAARRIPHTAVAPILVLTGGLVFRFVIVNAGQLSHWAAL
jgi:formate-dependent nitrite reductase membrane component NrfD